jgi:phosphatidylglycerol:prolipoprotein diacylglycerol transferase
MAPVLWDFGFVKIHGYGAMIGLGVLLAVFLALHRARQTGLHSLVDAFPTLFTVMAISATLGGKGLWWLMATPAERSASSGGAGFVYYGALLLVVPATIAALRWKRVPLAEAEDILGMFLPFTHAFGRVGCFLAGCCHGSGTDVPWAVTFEAGMGLRGIALHPTQLYEAGANLLIFAALWCLSARRTLAPGLLFGLTLTLTGISRIATEFFRGDVPGALWGNASAAPGDPPPGITQAQAIGASMAVLGVVLMRRALRNRRRS